MRTTRRLLAVLVAASGLAACDFTPTLDIETPEYVPGVAVRGFLVADSVAVVRLGESWDPYEGRSYFDFGQSPETLDATVTLLRDGGVVEVLTVRSQTCERFDRQTGAFTPYECGPYAGLAPIEAGATYTLLVEAANLPTAEATVTVPRRPVFTGTEEVVGADAPRRLRLRLGDPAGAGDLYGLSLFSFNDTSTGTICTNGVCRDTTYVLDSPSKRIIQYDTSDPLLVASAREFDDSIRFAPFSDETFDGRTKAFTISPDGRYSVEDREGALVVQVAALSGDVYDAYLIEYTSGGDDNPFAEPVNLPSNVEGGYGLVGGIAVAEAAFDARDE